MERDAHIREDQYSNGRVLVIAGGASVAAAAAIAGLNRLREDRQPADQLNNLSSLRRASASHNAALAKHEYGKAKRRPQKEQEHGLRRRVDAASSFANSGHLDGKRTKAAARAAKEAAAARVARAQTRARYGGDEATDVLRHQIEAARSRAKELRHDVPRLDRKRRKKQAEAWGDMAAASLRSARERAEPALGTVRKRAPVVVSGLGATATDRIHQVAEYAADLADTARSRAGETDMSAVAANLRPAGESVRDTLNRLKGDVAPVARDAAVQAAAAAIQLWETTRDQAADLDTEDLQRASSDLFADFAARAKEATATATAVTRDATDDLADRTDEARDRAEELTRRAATATAETSKDATAILVWAGIAGGLVYYGLLSETQRNRVESATRSLYSGVTELVRDIQGYDADF